MACVKIYLRLLNGEIWVVWVVEMFRVYWLSWTSSSAGRNGQCQQEVARMSELVSYSKRKFSLPGLRYYPEIGLLFVPATGE